MNSKMFLALTVLVIVGGLVVAGQRQARAGEVTAPSGYKVLEPIRHGNLTVFPVVAAKSYPTGEFLTLDEGLRSGDVVVTEAGNVQGLIRRGPVAPVRHDGAQVNRLVLVNNSKRPLLLLAGEIVSGGKQDRVIGKDRIVPPESDPVDLSVFCVEPGRWVATSEHFGASEAVYGGKHWRSDQRKRGSSHGDHGAAVGARQGHGRQGSERGLGRSAEATDGGERDRRWWRERLRPWRTRFRAQLLTPRSTRTKRSGNRWTRLPSRSKRIIRA